MMKIDGVVVLYGSNDDVLNNINSYIKELNKLYVVDNTPNRNITKLFKSKKIEYIPLKKNKGISYALNVGANKAIDDGASWLLTMDQDSCFEKDSLKKLVSHLKSIKKDGIKFNKRMINYDQIGIISPYHKVKFNNNHKQKSVLSPLVVMTSGNLVNLDAYKEVNGYNEDFFIDCVDFDFCFKLRNKGYEILEFGDAKLDHGLGDIKEYSFFGKKTFVTNHNYIRRYYITRNRFYLYDLYNEKYPLYCKAELHCTKMEFIKIWLYEKNKIKKTKAIIKGYLDYKKGVVGEYVEKNRKN